MTCRDIYTVALEMVAEALDNDNSDYEERAPYLLASFCSTCRTLDARYREANGCEAASDFSDTCLNLEDAFPLHRAFSSPAAAYLAAMLVVDENEELSDRFCALYSDRLAQLQAELPCKTESIQNRYVGLL